MVRRKLGVSRILAVLYRPEQEIMTQLLISETQPFVGTSVTETCPSGCPGTGLAECRSLEMSGVRDTSDQNVCSSIYSVGRGHSNQNSAGLRRNLPSLLYLPDWLDDGNLLSALSYWSRTWSLTGTECTRRGESWALTVLGPQSSSSCLPLP